MKRGKLKAVNAKRKARLRLEQFGQHAERIRGMFCVVPGCPEPTEAAHYKSRGAGGKAMHLFPCCRGHHQEQHDLGIETWQRKYGLDLAALAAHLWAKVGN